MRIENSIKWPCWWREPDQIDWLVSNEVYHSKSGRIRFGNQWFYLKIYGLSTSEDRFNSVEEVERLIADIAEYRCNLRLAGIRTPDNIGYSVEKNKSYYLFILETYVGLSLRLLMDQSDGFNLLYWLKQITNLLSCLFRTMSDNSLQVGLDPKPSNFVVDENKQLSYVDLVWPLNVRVLAEIHADISPIWHFRYFSKVGVLLNWLIQFSRVNPLNRMLVISQIADFLDLQKENQVKQVFFSLPGIVPLDIEVDILLAKIPFWNVDLLRAVGIQIIAEHRSVDMDFLKEVFNLSRTNPHQPLPSDKIKKCRDLLCDTIKGC